jgi:hypothetical protein
MFACPYWRIKPHRWTIRTVEVCGSNKGDVDTKITVMSRAIEAKVDTEGDRRPGRVLGVTVKAYLLARRPLVDNGQISPQVGQTEAGC